MECRFNLPLSFSDMLDKVLDHETPPHRPSVPLTDAPLQVHTLMTQCWDDVSECRPTFDVITKTMKSLSQ